MGCVCSQEEIDRFKEQHIFAAIAQTEKDEKSVSSALSRGRGFINSVFRFGAIGSFTFNSFR